MKQRTRSMGFLKAIFEDGVDCILTPGKVITLLLLLVPDNPYAMQAFRQASRILPN